MSNKKTLESLKSMFAAPDNKERTGMPNNYYPFWNMKEGEQCKIRFLPDLNEDNPYGFLLPKPMHPLVINGEKKSVPCMSIYGQDCPICKVSQDYYKIKDEVNGKKYWKKKQYLTQALVVEDPLAADEQTGEKHTGKVRYIALTHQLYNVIQEAFKSDDLEAIPYDYHDGYDFIIKKTKQGEYANYTVGTKFANRQRALTEDELATVQEHLADLSTLLPKNPGAEKVEAMLEAALTGGSYDEDAPSEHAPSRPPVRHQNKNDDSDDIDFDWPNKQQQQSVQTSASAQSSDDGEAANKDIADTLAAIRARRGQQNS